MAKKEDQAPAAATVEKVETTTVKAPALPQQEDMKPGVPDQEPPTKGPTARVDGDPNKPGEKL